MDHLKVDYLRKVVLLLEAGSKTDKMDLTDKPTEFEFIFGIGVNGVTEFEKQLHGKELGDEVVFHIKPDLINEMFEHIEPPLFQFKDRVDSYYLKTIVESVSRPKDREVIQAISIAQNSCKNGCNCGCNCSS